jgi:hypothetical protein
LWRTPAGKNRKQEGETNAPTQAHPPDQPDRSRPQGLIAEKEIEDLKSLQAQLGADLRRFEQELARLVKGAVAPTPIPRRAKRVAAKSGTKKAQKKAAAKGATAKAAATIETIVVGLLKANGAPMAVPEILASIKKQKLVKT